jgi:hypothetical protein
MKKADLPILVTSLFNAVAKAIVYAVGILVMFKWFKQESIEIPIPTRTVYEKNPSRE